MRPSRDYGWNPIESAPLDEDIALQLTDGRGAPYVLQWPCRRTEGAVAILTPRIRSGPCGASSGRCDPAVGASAGSVFLLPSVPGGLNVLSSGDEGCAAHRRRAAGARAVILCRVGH